MIINTGIKYHDFTYDVIGYFNNISIKPKNIILRKNKIKFSSTTEYNDSMTLSDFAITQLSLANSESSNVGCTEEIWNN